MQQYLESVGEMLGCLVSDKHTDFDAFLGAAVAKEHVAAMPELADGRFPTWANDMMEASALGKVKLSTSHYMGTIMLDKVLFHAMIDTCGAKSMMDRQTAEEMGYNIEVATRNKHFGSFYGPGGKTIYYYGRIVGPINVWFENGVKLIAPEIKIVEHFEPLVLIGTDVLTDSSTDWKFCYVGLHPKTRKGMIVLANRRGETKEIPLATWPLNGRAGKSNLPANPVVPPAPSESMKLKDMLQKSKNKRLEHQKKAK